MNNSVNPHSVFHGGFKRLVDTQIRLLMSTHKMDTKLGFTVFVTYIEWPIYLELKSLFL